jgi:hypothetical protein
VADTPAFPKPERRPKVRKRLTSNTRLVTRTRLRPRTRLTALRWMKRRPPRRLDRPQNDVARLDWCRRQPCYRCGREPTEERPNQACHEGRKPGTSLKCTDAETFPMCPDCHRQWTDGQSTNGFARHWDKAQRRAWADERIAEATARYLSHGNRRAA